MDTFVPGRRGGKTVPFIPPIRDLAARIRNTAISTTSKTTSSMFTREVLVMLNRHIPGDGGDVDDHPQPLRRPRGRTNTCNCG